MYVEKGLLDLISRPVLDVGKMRFGLMVKRVDCPAWDV
jgi:hypothetical protein